LNQCPGLGDIILQAFIARRQLLRESANFVGLRVIGSRHSPDTFRVRDFLARNRVLFTWVDLETDPQVDGLLKDFGVTEADEIGLHQRLEQTVFDQLVVGGGPGRFGGRGLRRVRRADDSRIGFYGSRWPSGQQHAD
jgi:thioredoxin reductase (NADPH)